MARKFLLLSGTLGTIVSKGVFKKFKRLHQMKIILLFYIADVSTGIEDYVQLSV